jgi:hypothetical protein
MRIKISRRTLRWAGRVLEKYTWRAMYPSNGVLRSWRRGGAAHLDAHRRCSPPPSPGEIIVDDTDAGFVKGGSTTDWRTAEEGYNRHLTWVWNNNWQRYNFNWARWYPNIAPERYEVFVYVPERYTTTSNARYWVSHRDGFTRPRVDQSENGERWVSLDTYWFRGDREDYVSLADVTYEPHLSRLIAFDAVKWAPR